MSERLRLHDPETRELALADLKELARTQPKVPVDDPRLAEFSITGHTQFGNNFFVRFPDLKASLTNEAQRARCHWEDVALDIDSFYAEHGELCDAICEAIDNKKPFDRLLAGYVELLRQEVHEGLSEGKAEELNDAAEHPFGIDAIGMYYWDRINPLLEEAYGLLQGGGVNVAALCA